MTRNKSAKPEEIIKFAAKGNAEAEVFMLAWFHFCHLLDDLVDRDKERGQRTIAMTFAAMLLNISSNPFYQQHRSRFESLIEQSFMAWCDSDDWRTSEDKNERVIAHCLKGFYHEIIFHAARICGGWLHGEETARKFRHYDVEDV